MIQPIETKYGGYRFRSRTEARWAVFLDAIGEPWEYEKEGYELSKWYLPDFYLPRMNCWLEIKGQKPTDEEIKLCEELSGGFMQNGKYVDGTGKAVALAWGCPFAATPKGNRYRAERLMVYCYDSTDGSGGNQWWPEAFWAIHLNGKPCLCSNNSWSSRGFLTPNYEHFPMYQNFEIAGPLPDVFIEKSKSARFEFGETPPKALNDQKKCGKINQQ